MSTLKEQLEGFKTVNQAKKSTIINEIQKLIERSGYEIFELNAEKPWGAYFRLSGKQADRFVEEFFPGLNAVEARLGIEDAELSPKVLMVSPTRRLSWQYHERRAERWAFLTAGGYNKSESNEPGELIEAHPGDVVQFAKSERHRLVGRDDGYTIVAEIWQHTDEHHPSDEADIVRLADDYSR